MEKTLIIRNAGTGQQLQCDVGCHQCGDVQNGVGFQFGSKGWFVIPLEELERIVSQARAYRERRSPSNSSH